MQKLTINSSVKLASGYKMPLLGFGVYQNYTTKDSCLEALKAGYRHIDSAQVYKNEAHVGQAVHASGIERGEIFISYVDLFLIHDPFSGKQKRLDTYKALLEGQANGKIRTVGVSNYGVKHLEEIKEAGYPPPSVNQIELHPFCQQKDIVEYCRQNNIVIQAYCPIIRGQMDDEIFTRLAQKYNKEPAQILLRWSLQRGFVPLPKSATPSRILSNTKLYDFELSSEDIEALDSLDKGKDGAISWNPMSSTSDSQPLALDSTVKLSSGYDMPLLGFGVYQNNDAKPSCLEAFKAGYSHIDSAQMYRNEAQVGEAVRESGIPREKLFITTKCASSSHGYESTIKGIDSSLQKFKFDYIDLFLIHDPLSGTARRLETYKALLEGKANGKIRTVGVSNYSVKHLEEIRNAGYDMPSVNQIELHPFCQQKDIVEYCKKNDIVVQAYCPIIRGKMDNPVIQRVAQKYQRDPAQVLIRWSLQHGFVPLPKSATPARIHSNAQVYDFVLDADDMQALDGLDRGSDGAISWNPVNAD
ncbi:hypothetical protein CVT24_003333 [Panaeolus cyanescens]|uniref:NADP-dependent oxidoreductase domain-containing protein n=1 Tax=Panaeolus cyanescens TaxID=181874 RepID=A0A409Y6U1_9AGAR|nr:hypothetical protein CVT24_003333 [Panaeolus cyanescens]